MHRVSPLRTKLSTSKHLTHGTDLPRLGIEGIGLAVAQGLLAVAEGLLRPREEFERALVGRVLVAGPGRRRLEHPPRRVRLEARRRVPRDELVRGHDEPVQALAEGAREAGLNF